jgi:AcrR family transcriptional regulator
MQHFLSNIQIKINEHLYLKDPESSTLGKKIISGSIDLIHEIGFESFNFKKLAESIGSTEASIYRYFENKHKVLLYLTIWYWGWTESKLIFAINNIEDKEIQLKKAIQVLTSEVQEDGNFKHINERKLQKVIIDESAKAYLNKFVDDENKHGVYSFYKSVVQNVSEIILAINPNYLYPKMLVSTIIEGAHLQRFFGKHLPSLTNCNHEDGRDDVQEFSVEMALNLIKK